VGRDWQDRLEHGVARFRQGEAMENWASLVAGMGLLGMGKLHLFGSKKAKALPGRNPCKPRYMQELCFGTGARFLASCL
jgi:hypothetical protein